jgi:hypothetical protein
VNGTNTTLSRTKVGFSYSTACSRLAPKMLIVLDLDCHAAVGFKHGSSLCSPFLSTPAQQTLQRRKTTSGLQRVRRPNARTWHRKVVAHLLTRRQGSFQINAHRQQESMPRVAQQAATHKRTIRYISRTVEQRYTEPGNISPKPQKRAQRLQELNLQDAFASAQQLLRRPAVGQSRCEMRL